ncbi:hypothetical protein F4809DRAFT_233812 [Biscogniauxia mediterranea]|nr:hypothetical protein F4809DRAFT_233812 [Biscogniauxia mediterranea]
MSAMVNNEHNPPSSLGIAQHHVPRTSTSRSSRSHGSYETGESSAIANYPPDSSAATTLPHPSHPDPDDLNSNLPTLEHGNRDHNDGQRRRRSYKPRQSGGFLLNTIADGGSKSSLGSRDGGRRRSLAPESSRRGKSPFNAFDRSALGADSDVGLGLESHGMADSGNGQLSSHPGPNYRDERRYSQGSKSASKAVSMRPTSAPLDMDSTQIVNMALNLSESRRMASRRNISTPVPPRLTPLPDSPGGGGLKQHLQQQRRSSRTLTPNPEIVLGLSPRNVTSPRVISPLQPGFEHEGNYTYRISSSTLNRAQRAKEHLELMAQYRRLLQFLPPLKPDPRSRPSTASPPGSPTSAGSPQNPLTSQPRILGRPYNPLQYIRNRKVRARERKIIDGEAQGFGDVSRVTDWIDETAASAATSHPVTDSPSLPVFPGAHEDLDQQHLSASSIPRSTSIAAKPQRSRIDWSLNPADMIADIYWLEQDDNKYLIEDRHYGKIFQKPAPHRPSLHQTNEPLKPTLSIPTSKDEIDHTRTSMDFEDPKVAKADIDISHTSARDRARQKLQDLRGIHHKHNNSAHTHHDFLRLRRGSLSDTSDSDTDRRRRGRSNTISANGIELLEKQMNDILARESREGQKEAIPEGDISSFKPLPGGISIPGQASQGMGGGHSRRSSRIDVAENLDKTNRGKLVQISPVGSGRASLEVPAHTFRASMDLDSSRPVSPVSKLRRRRSHHLPTIGMDLSPPGSRPSSPARNPFSKVKHMFRDRSRERVDLGAHEKEERVDSPIDPREPARVSVSTEDGSQSPERLRSKSPMRKIVQRSTDESHKSHRSIGSIKIKGDEQVGLRSIFKGGVKIDGMIRGGVSKVTDLIWRKDSESESLSSSTSSDDSDMEQSRGRKRISNDSNNSSRTSSKHKREGRYSKQYLDVIPQFKPTSHLTDKSSREADLQSAGNSASRPPSRSARFDQLKPPRIDIRRASLTTSELEQAESHAAADSDISDDDSRPRDLRNFRPRQASRELDNIMSLPSSRMPKQLQYSYPITERTGGRHWSISDRNPSPQRGQISKREIARLRTLILCSGIKAMEISRRANESHPLFALDNKVTGLPWTDISRFVPDEQASLSVPQTEIYPTTARILSDSIERSVQTFEEAASKFSSETAPALTHQIDSYQGRVATELIDMTRRAADEADEVSRDLVDSQRLKVKSVMDTMDKMLRRRRRRFRWVRRAGWLAVEWVLVGFMWYVWFVVMIARIFLGIGKGVVKTVRWLLWL